MIWQPGLTLEDIERMVILEALRFHHGNRTQTAKVLNVSLRTVANKISKYIATGHTVTPAASYWGGQNEDEKKDI